MAKKIGEAGCELIKSFEGCRLEAYKCSAGVWTIGYGHTGKVGGKAIKAGMKITQEKAEELLKQDLKSFETAVSKAKKSFIPTQNQFDALVSFAYNVGASNLTVLLAKGTRTAKEVSVRILLYNKANGKELAGLTRRRKAEQTLFIK